jgi:hypothetical protein
MTIDNVVTEVRYNGQPIDVSGPLDRWEKVNTFSFDSVEGAYLEIGGYEASKCDGCQCSGLLVECDNGFVSNTDDWTAVGSAASIVGATKGYSAPCQSSSSFFLPGQTSKATKIWASGGEKYAWFRAKPVVNEGSAYCNAKSKNPQGCRGGCAWNRRLQSCEPFSRSTQRMMFASDFQVGGNPTNSAPKGECHHAQTGFSNYIFQTKEFCEKHQGRVKDRWAEYGRRLVEMATFTLGENKCASEGQSCQCDGTVLYGSDSRWTEAMKVEGTIDCSNDVFGDPAPGTKKFCQCFQHQSSKTVSRADGIFMNGDMTIWGHKKEYAHQYHMVMQEAKKFGMPYFPGLGNHDFGPMMESAAAFGMDPDSGTEPILGRRRKLGQESEEQQKGIRYDNALSAMFLNENVNNERSYYFMKRFIDTYCHGGPMYTGAWHGTNIRFAENQCDGDKRLYSYDQKSLGYSVYNKGVLYFQLQKNPSAPDFAMKEHNGFEEYTRFTVEGTGRWFLKELEKVEKDNTVHAIVLNWHYPSCLDKDHEMCNLSLLEKIYRAIERHNRNYPTQRVIAVFTGHWHTLVGDSTTQRYAEGRQNEFFRRAGVPIFQTGSSYASSALDIDIDLESKSFTVSAWGRKTLNSPLIRHCINDNGATTLCTVYNFDGTKKQIQGHSSEAPWMTNPGASWKHPQNGVLTTTKPLAICSTFTRDTGLDCWDEVENGALVPHAFCEGEKCTRNDVQRCCKSASVTCLRKHECCAAGTQCYGCPHGAAEAVWLDKCWSFARCSRSGGCRKRPGQCCIWGSYCHGCPWGTDYVTPNVCGSSRRCKLFPE